MHKKQLELLVSVRNLTEAKIAFSANVDIIDIKEPNSGSLGAAPWDIVRSIVGEFPQTTISAALGEIDECEIILRQSNVTRKFKSGTLTYAKCGLANSFDASSQVTDWQTRASYAWSKISEFASPVAVAYADHGQAKSPSPMSILQHAIACDVNVLLIDTFLKNGISSLGHMSLRTLMQLTELARKNGVKTVLAGSISKSDLPRISETKVNCVAVRGAVCAGGRTAELSERLLRDFQDAISRNDKNVDIEIA